MNEGIGEERLTASIDNADNNLPESLQANPASIVSQLLLIGTLRQQYKSRHTVYQCV